MVVPEKGAGEKKRIVYGTKTSRNKKERNAPVDGGKHHYGIVV